MSEIEMMNVNVMRFGNGAVIMKGTASTRAVARLELAAVNGAVGSYYISNDRSYQKIANAGADADLAKVSNTDAD